MNKTKLQSKILEIFPILLGFFLGQGVFFVLQSYLIFNGDLTSVAQLSIGIGVLSTCLWLCDLGGGVFQSKVCSSEGVKKGYLFNYLLARLLMLPFSLLTLGLFWYFESSSDVRDIYSLGFLGVALWCFNWTGVFDSLGMNRKVAMYQSINFLLVSIYIYTTDEVNWVLVGVYFSVGVLVTIIIHNLILLKFVRLSAEESNYSLTDVIKEGVIFNVSFSFGQIYGRVIQLSVNNTLGLDIGGGYAYAKSLVSALQQLAGFIKRVELPDFYKKINTQHEGRFRKYVANFRLSWTYCVLSMLGVVAAGAAINFFEYLDEVSIIYLIAFTGLMPMWLAASILGNNLIAIGMTRHYILSQLVGFLGAAIIVFITFPYILIWAVWASELFLFTVQIIIMLRILTDREKV